MRLPRANRAELKSLSKKRKGFVKSENNHPAQTYGHCVSPAGTVVQRKRVRRQVHVVGFCPKGEHKTREMEGAEEKGADENNGDEKEVKSSVERGRET